MTSSLPSEALLRIPAAIVVIGMATLLIIDEFLFSDLTGGGSARDYLPVAVLGIPFVLPWSWFRTRTRSLVLISWVGLAALLTTIQSVRLLIWFYPRRSLELWLVIQIIFAVVTVTLSLAVAAAWRRRPRPGT